MMKLEITESISIRKPMEDIKAYVADLGKWHEWSPWLCMDSQAKVFANKNVQTGLNQLSWDGKYVGKGTTTLVDVRENGLALDLSFLKPFKTESKAFFEFESQGDDQTKVIWKMEGKWPFFLFFMHKIICKMISSDYKHGLRRLKSILEEGKVPATFEFTDEPYLVEAFTIYGCKSSCSLAELPKTMSSDFQKIDKSFKEEDAEVTGSYCFYEKVNLMKGWFSFFSAFSGKKDIQNLEKRQIPEHSAVKVTLKGDYKFIEVAWSALMNHVRAGKWKASKKVHSYEKYIVTPMDKGKEYVTEIVFPIKK